MNILICIHLSGNSQRFIYLSILGSLFLLFIPFSYARSQETVTETLLEINEEMQGSSDVLDFIQELKDNPLNVNYAAVEQLQTVPGISPYIARNIETERQTGGDFLSLSDMKKRIGIDDEIFEMVRHFLSAGKKLRREKIKCEITSRTVSPLEESRGFSEGIYYDSPLKQYNRFTFSVGDKIKGGVVFEKDSGEKPFNDHQSFYIEMNGITDNYKIVAGNYKMEFGEGLVFWSPYGFRKGSETIYPLKKNSRGIMGYKSSDENGGMRGAAVQGTASLGGQSTAAYYIFGSEKKIDTNINESGFVTSLFNSGYHRTELESSKKNNVTEKLYGGRLEARLEKKGRIGITGYYASYSRKFISSEKDVYKFQGDKNSIISTDFRYSFSNSVLFGEAAQSRSGGTGIIGGALFDYKKAAVGILFRRYDADFHSSYGRGFGEKGYESRNEQGIYFGMKYNISPKVKLYGYFDQYSFPQRSYFVPFSASGTDGMVRWVFRKSSKTRFECRVQLKKEETPVKVTNSLGNEKTAVGDYERMNIRFQAERTMERNISVRFRAEGVFVSKKPQEYVYNYAYDDRGIIMYIDLRKRILKGCEANVRYSYFSSEKGTVTFYQYERDMRGVLRIAQLHGIGSGLYGLLTYNISRRLSGAVKYSVVQYPHLSEIGTGYDKIEGNVKGTLSFQIEIKL